MNARAAVAALVALALTSTTADADTEQTAAAHFRAAKRAFEARDYTLAATEFEAANRIQRAGAALLAAGIAWELAGDALRAADDFGAASDAGDLEPHDLATAREHLAAVEAKLGFLDAVGPRGARFSVDGRGDGGLPIRVRVAPGVHRVDVRFDDGTSQQRETSVAAGSVTRIDFAPATLAAALALTGFVLVLTAPPTRVAVVRGVGFAPHSVWSF